MYLDFLHRKKKQLICTYYNISQIQCTCVAPKIWQKYSEVFARKFWKTSSP